MDTRVANGALGGPVMAGGTSRSFPIPSTAYGIPSSAAAYSVNVTVIPSRALGYLTAGPTGQPQPLASTLNSWDGSVLSNAAIIHAGTDATDDTDVVVDINGRQRWFELGGGELMRATPYRGCAFAQYDGAARAAKLAH